MFIILSPPTFSRAGDQNEGPNFLNFPDSVKTTLSPVRGLARNGSGDMPEAGQGPAIMKVIFGGSLNEGGGIQYAETQMTLRDTELLDPAGFGDALHALVVESKDEAYARRASFMLPRNWKTDQCGMNVHIFELDRCHRTFRMTCPETIWLSGV